MLLLTLIAAVFVIHDTELTLNHQRVILIPQRILNQRMLQKGIKPKIIFSILILDGASR